MEEHRTDSRRDDVEVSGPLGWRVRFPARQLGGVVLVLAACGAILYMLREHDMKQTEQTQAAVVSRDAQLKQVNSQQQQLQESMDTMVYVLALSPEDRIRLKLDMPPTLRAKLLSSERAR